MAERYDRDAPEFVELINQCERHIWDRIDSLSVEGYEADLVAKEIVEELFGSPLDEDGYLPVAPRWSMGRIAATFGQSNKVRSGFMGHLEGIVEHIRHLSDCRVLIGGSFVTGKSVPADIDLAAWVPNFGKLVRGANEFAVAINEIRRANQPGNPIQLFVESDEAGWWSWWRIFCQTKEPVSRVYKGTIEVRL